MDSFPIAMVDMSKTPEDIKEEMEDYASPGMPSYEPPKYPYGLCISLCENELAKLGLGDAEAAPGDGIQIMAMGKVTSSSQRENADGSIERRVEIQITHLGLGPEHYEMEGE